MIFDKCIFFGTTQGTLLCCCTVCMTLAMNSLGRLLSEKTLIQVCIVVGIRRTLRMNDTLKVLPCSQLDIINYWLNSAFQKYIIKSGEKKQDAFKNCSLEKSSHFVANPHETWRK